MLDEMRELRRPICGKTASLRTVQVRTNGSE